MTVYKIKIGENVEAEESVLVAEDGDFLVTEDGFKLITEQEI